MKWEKELYHHEINPPEEVWGRIVHDLDNEFIVFKQALYNASVSPPPHQWDAIRQRLDAGAGSSSKLKSIAKIWRIAAAAAFIGASLFAVNYLMTRQLSDTNMVTGEKPLPVKSIQKQDETTPTATQISKSATLPVRRAGMASMISFPKKRKTSINPVMTDAHTTATDLSHPTVHISSVPGNHSAVTDRYPPDHAATKHIRDLKGEIKEDVQLQDLRNSYFFTTGANGQSVRVSSKFRNIIQHLNSGDHEPWMDDIMKEKQNWQYLFKQWKAEMNHSLLLPSAGNFMDIAQMMQLLQAHYNK